MAASVTFYSIDGMSTTQVIAPQRQSGTFVIQNQADAGSGGAPVLINPDEAALNPGQEGYSIAPGASLSMDSGTLGNVYAFAPAAGTSTQNLVVLFLPRD